MQQGHPKLSKAKARLMLQHPFFATLLMRTEVIVTDQVETAATDGNHHYYNPAMLEASDVEQVMSDLAHESCHDAFLHSVRLGTRDQRVANIAMDLAINPVLEEAGFKVPHGGWLSLPKYKGWHWERIYDDLRRRSQMQPQSGQGKPGQPKPGQGQPQPGPGKPGDPNGDGPIDLDALESKIRLKHDVQPTKAASPAEQAAAEQKAKQKLASAANAARLAGKLGGSLQLLVDGILGGKVPWTEVLREYMTRVVRSRENWTRRNRRWKEVYLPKRWSQEMGPIVFIPDTSGSMLGPDSDIQKICTEIAECTIQCQPENIRVIWVDAKVQGEQVFYPSDFAYEALKPQGGGGTDMRVAIEYAKQRKAFNKVIADFGLIEE